MPILTLIGAIALFLFALRLISEGFQKIAGDHMRHAQSAMTGNAFRGMLTGVGLTAFLQSSQVTTIMAVSFVNAGIITLAQSMAVIMGANIGTTVTAWLIALFGFGYDAYLWSFPIIALTLPFFNAHRSTANSWGELLLGIALLLLSVETMEQSCAAELFGVYSYYITRMCEWGFGGHCLLVLVGMLLTTIVRTSVATFALTLVACSLGWITFPMACAVMIGANIGTCIPSLFMSRAGNAMARRAALGHLLFNVVGLVLALCLFPWYCQFSAITGQLVLDIALFHTLFNVVPMLLLLPLNKYMVKAITRILPESHDTTSDSSFALLYIGGDIVPSSGEMALVQAQSEVSRYAAETYRMFTLFRQMVTEPMGSDRQLEIQKTVCQMEKDSDRAELEIAQFLNRIDPHTLSISGEQLCRSLYKVVDELESVADSIYHCTTTLLQKSEQLIRFTPQMNAELTRMLSLTDDALKHTAHVLSLDEVPTNALNRAYNIEDEINNLRNQLRNQMLTAIEHREIGYQQYSFFSLLINECEKMGDYVVNVIAAASV